MVDVFYLDYGQPECVTLDRLCKSTPGDIASRPALARYITLEGVKPVSVRSDVILVVKLRIHLFDKFTSKVNIKMGWVINIIQNVHGKLKVCVIM